MKKGFTLVELLAVMVIIGMVSILMLPKILERFENKKIEISNEAKELLYVAADQYMKINSLSSLFFCQIIIYITTKTFILYI